MYTTKQIGFEAREAGNRLLCPTRRRCRRLPLLGVLALVMGLPQVVLAGPREDAKDAYTVAMRQRKKLESAVMTIEAALTRARRAGIGNDPSLAPLLVLRGALIYSKTADRPLTVANFEDAIRADHDIQLPRELWSEELETLLETARNRVQTPGHGRVDRPPPPPPPPRQQTTFEAVSSAPPSSVEAKVAGNDGRRFRRRPWPRLYLNLGIGTGIGITRGVAEQTYEQYAPDDSYGPAQQACAIARWSAGNDAIAPSASAFAEALDPSQIPSGAASLLEANYDPEECARRHSVTLGIASAPLHMVPEVMVQVHERNIGRHHSLSLLIGAFGRLQLVTGSRVFTEDPSQARELSFYNQVSSSKPSGTRRKPGFTWAAGTKLEALISKRGGKLQGMVGLFAGFGHSRLRVDLGFSNDRNGNSVPDELETALAAPMDENDDGASVAGCTPVWPYNNACDPGSSGEFDAGIADSVRASVPDGDRRIDTVRLGPAFAGILFGFHYQPHEHFGLYGELDVGGWFPGSGSLLIDINVGPSIMF